MLRPLWCEFKQGLYQVILFTQAGILYPAFRERGKNMSDNKKAKKVRSKTKRRPAFDNDQLGENSGEGRAIKQLGKN